MALTDSMAARCAMHDARLRLVPASLSSGQASCVANDTVRSADTVIHQGASSTHRGNAAAMGQVDHVELTEQGRRGDHRLPELLSQGQKQELPGEDQSMEPLAEHLKVEKWDRDGKPYLEEYKGTGKLQGKSAIITGGDSGIGRSVALFYAREGANVTIAYLPE
ncbi:hypothetical protein L1887_55806 [Cichorium endivia]|nr:hypothetical protein L1887_55806 [Cichorium endivia]